MASTQINNCSGKHSMLVHCTDTDTDSTCADKDTRGPTKTRTGGTLRVAVVFRGGAQQNQPEAQLK